MKTEDLNELANNLRKTKEFDEVRLLCKENSIPEAVAEKFIKGEQLILVEMGYLEQRKALQSPTWKAAREAIIKSQKEDDGNAQVAKRIRKGLLLPGETAKVEKTPEYTVEDVRKKLEAELEIYRDGDSKYVVEKLIERCEKDKGLLNAIMLPHKSYDKAFQYFYERSRTVGYKMPHGNMVYLDNDKAVELSVEYFKKDDKAEKKAAPPKEKPKQKVASKKPTPSKENPKQKEALKKPAGEAKKPEAPIPAEKPEDIKEPEKPKQQPKANKKEIDGQMSLFDF